MPYTRLMDKVVQRHPLVLVLQFQTLCSKSSAGRMSMTSSEKGTKQKEESCHTSSISRGRFSKRLHWTSQHLPLKSQEPIPEALGAQGREHLWWPYSQESVSTTAQPVTQHCWEAETTLMSPAAVNTGPTRRRSHTQEETVKPTSW